MNVFCDRADVHSVRREFLRMMDRGIFCPRGNLEIINAAFIADEPAIFGILDMPYINQELAWYQLGDTNIKTLSADPPKIWKQVAGWHGEVNSNYGHCIFSRERGNQFEHAIAALKKNPHTKRACMIYQRPEMQWEATERGKDDFICTWSVQLFIREKRLHYCVNMRSNDAIFGYKNDRAWHDWVFDRALEELREDFLIEKGAMLWFANTLHIYPRHHYLVEKKLMGVDANDRRGGD